MKEAKENIVFSHCAAPVRGGTMMSAGFNVELTANGGKCGGHSKD